MVKNHIVAVTPEQQLLSKAAINLPPRERLKLLLQAKSYPLTRKRTSAEAQIKEMLDFYKLCCLMLAKYFPSAQAENNFLLLSFSASQENVPSIANQKLADAFKMLQSFEELENKINALQMLFHSYQDSFPEIYQRYHLESLANERISDIIAASPLLHTQENIENLMRRWELQA